MPAAAVDRGQYPAFAHEIGLVAVDRYLDAVMLRAVVVEGAAAQAPEKFSGGLLQACHVQERVVRGHHGAQPLGVLFHHAVPVFPVQRFDLFPVAAHSFCSAGSR